MPDALGPPPVPGRPVLPGATAALPGDPVPPPASLPRTLATSASSWLAGSEAGATARAGWSWWRTGTQELRAKMGRW